MDVRRSRFECPSLNSEIKIDLYADTHFGSESVAEGLLKKHIEETRENGHYWMHLGDAIDGIVPSDRRFNRKNLSDWAWAAVRDNKLIEAEWARFEELFSPIADKCLYVLDGDGKHNICNDVSDCMATTLQKMGIPFGAVQLYYEFMCNRTKTAVKKVPIVFHHGFFAGRTVSNKVINLERHLQFYPQTWGFFCGHGHHKTSTRLDCLVVNCGGHIEEWVRRAAMTGSYLRTYAEGTTGYGEVRGYRPAALGRVTLVIRPFHTIPEKRIELENT